MNKDPILNLLSIYQAMQSIPDSNELAFFMTHQSKLLMPYRLAVAWDGFDHHDIKILSITGLPEVDNNTPVPLAFKKIIQNIIKNTKQKQLLFQIEKANLDASISALWPTNLPEKLLIKCFCNQKTVIGGICFFLDEWPEGNLLLLLNWLGSGYNFAWSALQSQKNRAWKRVKQKLRYRKTYKVLIGVLIVLFLVPVKQSVVAPVEIMPENPFVVTAPMDGVVKDIKVLPNQKVAQDQLLVELETRDLKSAYRLASQEYLTAKAEYRKAIHTGFQDIKNRAHISILTSKLREKRIEKEYAKKLMAESQIKSPIAGVAMVSNPTEWRGKPVKTGEKILTIAKPDQVVAWVWLPVSDAIAFKKDDTATLYLNNAPFASIDATVKYMSYEAELSPKNILSYKIVLDMKDAAPRIGTEGTARLKSKWTTLCVYLFRKPISYLRQTFGY